MRLPERIGRPSGRPFRVGLLERDVVVDRIGHAAASLLHLAKGRVITTLPSVGGPQETVCLRLDLINGWLFGIDAQRVRPEARDLVITYQEECHAVLFQHFYGHGAAGQGDAPCILATEDARKESIRTRRQLVSEARQTHGTNAARQLWAYLDLPIVPAMVTPRSPEFPFTYTAIRQEPAA